jgi:triacylglycerol lipase
MVAGDGVHFRLVKDGTKVTLVFPGTWDEHGWWHNFDIAVLPYRDMKTPFRVHRGFLKLWKSARDQIMGTIAAMAGSEITILGYSQGAALATLAHEDVGFQYPSMYCTTMAFASPRVLWAPPSSIRARFVGLTRYTVRGDIVTEVPPAFMGYSHIGADVKLGPPAFPWWTHHMPSEYERSLP